MIATTAPNRTRCPECKKTFTIPQNAGGRKCCPHCKNVFYTLATATPSAPPIARRPEPRAPRRQVAPPPVQPSQQPVISVDRTPPQASISKNWWYVIGVGVTFVAALLLIALVMYVTKSPDSAEGQERTAPKTNKVQSPISKIVNARPQPLLSNQLDPNNLERTKRWAKDISYSLKKLKNNGNEIVLDRKIAQLDKELQRIGNHKVSWKMPVDQVTNDMVYLSNKTFVSAAGPLSQKPLVLEVKFLGVYSNLQPLDRPKKSARSSFYLSGNSLKIGKQIPRQTAELLVKGNPLTIRGTIHKVFRDRRHTIVVYLKHVHVPGLPEPDNRKKETNTVKKAQRNDPPKFDPLDFEETSIWAAKTIHPWLKEWKNKVYPKASGYGISRRPVNQEALIKEHQKVKEAFQPLIGQRIRWKMPISSIHDNGVRIRSRTLILDSHRISRSRLEILFLHRKENAPWGSYRKQDSYHSSLTISEHIPYDSLPLYPKDEALTIEGKINKIEFKTPSLIKIYLESVRAL